MEINEQALELPKNPAESEGAEQTPQSPEVQRERQLEQVEKALKELAPFMEQFKNANEPTLVKNCQEQIAALEAQLGERLGIESARLIYTKLVTEVLQRKEAVGASAADLEAQKAALNNAGAKAERGPTTAKEKFNWHQQQLADLFRDGDVFQWFAPFGRSNPSEANLEEAAKRLGALRKEYRQDKREPSIKMPELQQKAKELADELNAQVKTESKQVVEVPAFTVESDPSLLTVEQQVDIPPVTPAEVTAPAEPVAEETAVLPALSPAEFRAKPIEMPTSDDGEDDHFSGGSGSGESSSSETDSPVATEADKEAANENMSEAAVKETIFNLVKAPETVIGNPNADGANESDKAVADFVDSLRGLYNSQDELAKRLVGLFSQYKLAWMVDRRMRPAINEAGHKKSALENISRELPTKEMQAIETYLDQKTGSDKQQEGRTREQILKEFFELVENESELKSPDTEHLEAA